MMLLERVESVPGHILTLQVHCAQIPGRASHKAPPAQGSRRWWQLRGFCLQIINEVTVALFTCSHFELLGMTHF